MRSIITLSLFFVFSVCSAQGWKVIDVVDDFGDKVGERIAFIGEGQFSNSATTNSEMTVRISVKPQKSEDLSHLESLETYTAYYDEMSKDWKPSTRAFAMKPKQLKSSYEDAKKKSVGKLGSLTFEFFEYNRSAASFMRKYESTMLKIKLEDGSIIEFYEGENKYADTAQYWNITCMKGTDTGKVWNAITDNKPIRAVVLHRNSSYKFSVDGYNLPE